MTNWEIRMRARECLRGNWLKPIIACLIVSLVIGCINAFPGIGWVGSILITGPLLLGQYHFFLKFVRSESPRVEDIFDGFRNFGSALVLYIVIAIFTILWTLLFIIPGVIAAIRYSQAYFIMRDQPDMSALDAIERSKQMMDGNKWKLFTLYLSFIGWAFLCVLTLGIGLLWLQPYMMTSFTLFHEDVRNRNIVRNQDYVQV